MKNVGYGEMHDMILKCQIAYDYAWEHYDELATRSSSHILYSAPLEFEGLIPTPEEMHIKRTFRKSVPRRKRYYAYELDQNSTLLRIKHINEFGVDCTYHVFELDGITYCQAFLREQKGFYPTPTVAIKYVDNRPLYYARGNRSGNYLLLTYFEYPDSQTAKSTTYLYQPNQRVAPGVPRMLVNHNAPYNAWNSPVTLDYYEGPYQHMDFKEWI